jgi:hypothetical protein
VRITDPKLRRDAIRIACAEGARSPDYYPDGSVTHCNKFVSDVAKWACDYYAFNGLLANEMFDIMSNEWETISLEQSYDAIENGCLVIAAEKSTNHGHVCIVVGGDTFSTKWNKHVPLCANVGKENFYGKGLNWAFADEPTLFCLKPHPKT